MQVVGFGEKGVEAYTLLAHGLRDNLFQPGVIGDIDSNVRRYAKKDWLRFPFEEADIMQYPKLKRTFLYLNSDGL